MKKTSTRPKELLYAVGEKPTSGPLWLLGSQYLILVCIATLVFPAILVKTAHASDVVAASVISMVMIASAIGTLLQSLKLGPVGSGYLLPLSANPAWFAPSMQAVLSGGLPLLFGMTIFGGAAQAFFSIALQKLRKVFPSEIAGVIIVLIGVELGIIGLRNYSFDTLNFTHIQLRSSISILLQFFPLLLLLFLNIWQKKVLQRYSLLLTFVISYILLYSLGYILPQNLNHIANAPWLAFPKFAPGGYSFSFNLMIPFIIGALVCAVKVVGSLAVLQEMQSTEWKKPDMDNISKGNLADSIGTMISGALGGMGLNASSSCTSLSLTTGVTSRYIAIPFAIIMLAISFCPKIALIFVYMPPPILAAIVLLLGANLIGTGFKLIMPRMHYADKRIVVGIAFMFGISFYIYPDFYQHLPISVRDFTGSSIALGAITGIALNLLSLGLKKIKKRNLRRNSLSSL